MSLPEPRFIRRAVDVAATAIGYFSCATATLLLTRFNGGVAIVWLSSAFLFAKLLTSPRRRWSSMALPCLVAGTASSGWFGIGGLAAVPIALVCVGEAYGSAWLLKRTCRRFGRFASVQEVGRFLAIAGLFVPASGAFVAALCVHLVLGAPYWGAWRDWYAGHALGLVGFGPPLLLLFRGEMGGWLRSAGRRQALEAGSLIGLVAIATTLTFVQSAVPLVAVPLVPMIACTFRLGRFGAVASIAILIGIGMPCSLMGYGPTALLPGSMSLKFQVLQIYFASVVVILLPVAAELKARRRLLDRLRSAEALHRLVLDRTSDLVLRTDTDGTIRYASPCATRMLAREPDQIAGVSLYDLILPEDVALVREARRRALTNPDETTGAEYRVCRRDGEEIWVESHIRATVNEAGLVTGAVSMIREITERRRVVEDLARKAASDPLTGLSNRRAFDEALAARASAPADSRTACLAIFDLDHFKRINDRYGHAMGDAVLMRFATLLRASLRDGDVVARLGGEEFAVLLSGVTVDQAHAICERIRVKLEQSRDLMSSGEPVLATVSGGIAALPAGEDPARILSAADAALYRAKSAGRNRLALAA